MTCQTGPIIVTDRERGTEIQLGPSEAVPGRTNVVIFARDKDEIQRIIQDLADEYNTVTFTLPARCADHRWAAMGRVWNEPLEVLQ